MAAYILKRLLLMIPTLFGVMLVTFVVTQFVPGGPVERLAHELQGRGAAGEAAGSTGVYRGSTGLDKARLDELKALYGFDKPAHVRFFLMLKNYLTFDLGQSYYRHQSVIELVIQKLPVSI